MKQDRSRAKRKSHSLYYQAIRDLKSSDIKVTILHRGYTSQVQASALERHYIAKLGTLEPKGFNKTRGSRRGSELGPEARKRLSERRPRRERPYFPPDLVRRDGLLIVYVIGFIKTS